MIVLEDNWLFVYHQLLRVTAYYTQGLCFYLSFEECLRE